jgi:hypothetical protein
MTQELNEEERKYVEENLESLKIAVKNCKLLFDPQDKQPEAEMFRFIDSNPGDRLLIYLFITNTCELVEGLTPQHIFVVCEFYKQMTDVQLS